MKKYVEVLSPVGDKETFFVSIKSGCDAVYLGLPKFNARMRADNIALEDLPELVRFAHLKNVRVYITMNTLLSNTQLNEAVELAGECLKCGVDAFIVQDLGLIHRLKNTYPNIVLHGSTQMGIHNVMGAKVAKSLGLSRIVLSRECTLADIREIANNVDIEIEVFVQGANCVCFSGNCYLSSIKCGASGNRGECKQLCRLSYTLCDDKKTLRGYTLSPRDNCMISHLKELIDAGVVSLKIEGRLKTSGYVSVATSVYRNVLDSILKGENFDEKKYKTMLYRVFSRGEFTSGYYHSNNIIDHTTNNHLGVQIGRVLNVQKFKDLWKVTMSINKDIVSGDGLKFKSKNNQIISIGVGNIEYIDKKAIVYTKNKIDIDSIVYLSHDTVFENSILDKSYFRSLKIVAKLIAGQNAYVQFISDDLTYDYLGDVVQSAKSRPITIDNIREQFGKVDSSIFQTPQFDVLCENAFLPLSKLNEIRRECLNGLTLKILDKYSSDYAESLGLSKNRTTNVSNQNNTINNVDLSKNNQSQLIDDFDPFGARLRVVNEFANIKTFVANSDALILKAENYSVDNIINFANEYFKYFSSPLIVDLPMILRKDDLKIIDDIVSSLPSDKTIFIANNIYGLNYAKDYFVWAGAGLNIVNSSGAELVKKLGAKQIISSIEKWTSRLENTIKLDYLPLMTITSCPVKLLYGNDCSDCKYNRNFSFIGDAFRLSIKRLKIANCYFELYSK